jgi:transposase-like protein
MKTPILSAIHFHNEEAAYAYIETRLWPNGPTCPHCGSITRISKMKGKSTRIGLYKCYVCRKPFTVKIGTIFEDSHVPMRLWLQAFYLMSASKKGISSNQLHRTLGVTLKTAWFMSHRIREAMRIGDFTSFGANGGIVEADETFIGKEPGAKKKSSFHHKQKVLSLIDRTSGCSRSFVIDAVNAKTILPILQENIYREARLITDDAGYYAKSGLKGYFAAHAKVNHSIGEYVHKRFPIIHTNTVEGFFSVFKRGMKGVYQWCKKRHLHRYLAEFDFRYNNRCGRPKTKKRAERKGFTDIERADILLRGVVGRRLTYETTYKGGIMN